VDAVADSDDPAEPVTLGRTLAREREQQGLSRADVAQRLHMSAWQVEALEAGDYSKLPKGTFLRGFVRNYAKVLGLPGEAVLSLLKEGRPHDPAPGIVVPTQNIRFDPIGERFSSPYVKAAVYAVVAVSAAFAIMYWWLFVKPAGKPAAAQATTATRSTPVAVVPQNLASAPLMPPAEPAPPKDLMVPAEPKPAAQAKPAEVPRSATAKVDNAKMDVPAAAAAKPVPAKGAERALKFRFKGESWVEVRDARGRVIFQQLNRAGSEADVTARPPLSIVIGNAPEVQLLMNGVAYNLEPHTRVAVARFNVE
jgi:cytoskeleton protein RodZ